SNAQEIDYRGGAALYTGYNQHIGVQCQISDVIQLDGGVHTIDVSARLAGERFQMRGGELSVKMTLYNSDTNFNLPYPTIPK
ncbi:unnamed protein product, partial [Rotaria sp. Silwood2]